MKIKVALREKVPIIILFIASLIFFCPVFVHLGSCQSAEEYFKAGIRFKEAKSGLAYPYIAYKGKGLDQAISEFNQLIERRNKLSGPVFDKPQIKLVDLHVYRGIAYLEKGSLDEAIVDFSKAIETLDKYEAYSESLMNEKQRRECQRGGCQKYFPQINYIRGIALLDKGNFDSAISDFSRALKDEPNSELYYYARAVAYFEKQEYDKSWQDLHKAEKMGEKPNLEFLENLKKASGRKK